LDKQKKPKRVLDKMRTSYLCFSSFGLLLLNRGVAAHDTIRASAIDEQRVINAQTMMLVDASNFNDIIDLWTDDVHYEEAAISVKGKDNFLLWLENLFTFSPDYAIELEDEVYDNGIYMCSWRMFGHSILDVPAWVNSGEPVAPIPYDLKGLSIIKFRDGETQAYYHKDLYTEGDIVRVYSGCCGCCEQQKSPVFRLQSPRDTIPYL
jgi:SnoaL-like domain